MATPTDLNLTALQLGEINLQGEFRWGSNYTFLVQVAYQGAEFNAVYKPTRGERPLWDFPSSTLARREVAAYLVSEGLGWNLVPPTVYRRQAPIGSGSLQLYVEHDPEYHYFNFSQTDHQRLRPVALLDVLINNADRKGSHILIGKDRHIWLIDHGVCFHVDDKLRTVIWDFAGEPLPGDLCADIDLFRKKLVLSSELAASLKNFLSPGEIIAMAGRADRLLASGQFPNPSPSRRFQPWPPI